MKIKGNLVDINIREIYPAEIEINSGRIGAIIRINEDCSSYILPGFVDAHIHIESSMLSPLEFSKQALGHGTVAIVNDPHEIANVCGMDGINFMIENSQETPLKIFFGAPSCVPATEFETAGCILNTDKVNELLGRNEVCVLSEMMNFPGVIFDDPEVLAKLGAARKNSKPIDGHAPGLSGGDLKKYIDAGISTDHECFTLEEAKEKISLGMNILIREGSAAKNFETLFPLIDEFPDKVMFCCDDKHPDDLLLNHLNESVKKALAKGANLFNVLRAVSYNPVKHYNLPVGLLSPGDCADFIIIDNLHNFTILDTFIDGKKVYNSETGIINLPGGNEIFSINNFLTEEISNSDIMTRIPSGASFLNVIEAIDGELITNSFKLPINCSDFNQVLADNQLNKLILINRYISGLPPVIGFIKGFNLKGAMASTIAHDSHNIIAVGDSDENLVTAINLVISTRGGLSFAGRDIRMNLPLEIGGIMTNRNAKEVAREYSKLENQVRQSGCKLRAPFMTLSFMALLVIPYLKISDKGLFDITKLSYIPLFE